MGRFLLPNQLAMVTTTKGSKCQEDPRGFRSMPEHEDPTIFRMPGNGDPTRFRIPGNGDPTGFRMTGHGDIKGETKSVDDGALKAGA
ncbi:hypothetical protein CRYUN_Cryun06bG0120500 [Craigia yunnanensis]